VTLCSIISVQAECLTPTSAPDGSGPGARHAQVPPLPGARCGSFAAACHYVDGNFVPAASQDACARTAPGTGAAFSFWHPDLVTLHVWLRYPNPFGLYASMNLLVRPFNDG